jgi:hypothetical protein
VAERPHRFTQRDIERAIKAAERAGKEVVRVRFADGGFEIVTSRPGADVAEVERNEWDEEL